MVKTWVWSVVRKTSSVKGQRNFNTLFTVLRIVGWIFEPLLSKSDEIANDICLHRLCLVIISHFYTVKEITFCQWFMQTNMYSYVTLDMKMKWVILLAIHPIDSLIHRLYISLQERRWCVLRRSMPTTVRCPMAWCTTGSWTRVHTSPFPTCSPSTELRERSAPSQQAWTERCTDIHLH